MNPFGSMVYTDVMGFTVAAFLVWELKNYLKDNQEIFLLLGSYELTPCGSSVYTNLMGFMVAAFLDNCPLFFNVADQARNLYNEASETS